MNNGEFFLPFIPISLFVCITYAVKAIVDARVRKQLVSANAPDPCARSSRATRSAAATPAALVIFVALAIGFFAIEAFPRDEFSPAVIAVLLGATGLGNLAYYAMSRKLKT